MSDIKVDGVPYVYEDDHEDYVSLVEQCMRELRSTGILLENEDKLPDYFIEWFNETIGDNYLTVAEERGEDDSV